MFAAFDAFENFERAVRVDLEFVDALELIGDAEPLADDLEGDARAARGALPAAEEQQLGFVQAGDGFDGVGEGVGGFKSVGEAAGGAVQRDQFKGDFLGEGHHHLLELGLGREADKVDLAAGGGFGEVGGFEKRVARPRIEHGGEHRLVLERGPGGAAHGFESLKRVRDNAAANDNLVGCAHKKWSILTQKGGRRLLGKMGFAGLTHLNP